MLSISSKGDQAGWHWGFRWRNWALPNLKVTRPYMTHLKRVCSPVTWTKSGRQRSADRILFLCQLYLSVLVKLKLFWCLFSHKRATSGFPPWTSQLAEGRPFPRSKLEKCRKPAFCLWTSPLPPPLFAHKFLATTFSLGQNETLSQV